LGPPPPELWGLYFLAMYFSALLTKKILKEIDEIESQYIKDHKA
jgi:hypothetical protein